MLWCFVDEIRSYFVWKTMTFDERVQHDGHENTCQNEHKKILYSFKEILPP